MAWGLEIELNKGVLLEVLGRAALLLAFAGYCDGRWSNIIDVGGIIAVIPGVTAGAKTEIVAF